MPVETRHPAYLDAAPKWQKARDFAGGVAAVKQAGQAYLPKLTLDTDDDYREYRDRAVFFAGTTRALEGLMGALFADEPKADVPEAMQALLDLFGQDGSTLFEFAKRCAQNALTVGRGLIVVDIPADPTHDPVPSAVFYPAEAVINWRSETVAGVQRLTLLVIEETVQTPRADDPYVLEDSKQWRVWTLEDGRARLRVQHKGKDGQLITDLDTIPQRSNVSLDEIPAVFYGSVDNSPDVDPVPIEALVEVNNAHYRTSADYYQTLHRIGCPTPFFAAQDATENLPKTPGPDPRPYLPLGSGGALITTDVNAKTGYMAVSPEQVAPLKDELANLVSLMAVLGARLLETQKTGVEAADTLRLRQNGQTSVLENIANTVGSALTKAAQWMDWWQTGNEASKAKITLNKQFTDTTLQAAMVVAIAQAVTAGAMSKETAAYNWQEGRLLEPDVTAEDEVGRLEAAAAVVPPPVPAPETEPVAAET